MKFVEDRPYAGLEAAAHKLLDIIRLDRQQRAETGATNMKFLIDGGSVAECSADRDYSISIAPARASSFWPTASNNALNRAVRGPPIGRGREVVTLGDAAVYIQKPPKAQHRLQTDKTPWII
jgi:hypothetical protein